MYVSTFYSYKGGVGRTFALVNVAVELAKTGRSVLLVDFDLEAPGLDTFSLFENRSNVGGVVQFVTDYMEKKCPPRVSDYVFEVPANSRLGLNAGKIWVMPAGRRNSSYDRLLAQIHWQDLYNEMEGFYLFEDLKQQWEVEYSPDYVLIDSRTGHTDVGGICTRQLADLVVLLFTPNEQNLKGLPPIVNAIREESAKSPDHNIETCFVASNVPTLDDEEGILRKLMGRFSKAFGEAGKRQRILVVQRYESLQLLNQDIFTLDRPKSRLSGQYREIAQYIVERNLNDREGVLDYLKHRVRNERVYSLVRSDTESRLKKILESYSNDAEVLLWAARCSEFQSSPSESIGLLEKAASALVTGDHFTKGEVHLDLANAYLANQQKQIASMHLVTVAEMAGLKEAMIRRLFELWYRADKAPDERLSECFSKAELTGLEARTILDVYSDRRDWQQFVAEVLVKSSTTFAENERDLLPIRVLSLLGSRQFSSLLELAERLVLDRDNVANQFNALMAKWAALGSPSVDGFRDFVTRFGNFGDRFDTNYLQCFALAFAVSGDRLKAREYLSQAFESNKRLPISKFSCWRYQEISQSEFEDDLNEIQSYIETGEPKPLFLRDV